MGGVLCIGSNPGFFGDSFSNYAPKPCSNFTAKISNGSVLLKWTDPDDYTTTDNYQVKWASTRIVRKTGSYPSNENDGTIVVTSTAKNQYQYNGFTDSNLSNNTTYYYRAFSCSSEGIYNREQVQVSATPVAYKIMTVKLNLANSNPSNIGSYADDATSMSACKDVSDWQEFFGYKPCLFKDGKVVGYLNPNDFTKFNNGYPADITSGNAGDVMIEFPRRGIKISKSGKVVTVSMTDDPNNSSFKYYAHQRGSVNKDYFYLGAYLGYLDGNKLRSISGKLPEYGLGLSTAYTYSNANGTGYGCISFYQLLFLQVMYVLQYKGNLDSQTVHGYGNCNSSSVELTGRSNSLGMMYGSTNVVKMFGIEDIYGNVWQLINNFYSDSNYHITTTTDDTITDVDKYTDRGSYGGSGSTYWNYFTDCMGTTEAGFTGTYNSTNNGSSSTYFCDNFNFEADAIPVAGGGYSNGYTGAGIFAFSVDYGGRDAEGNTSGSRLSYL